MRVWRARRDRRPAGDRRHARRPRLARRAAGRLGHEDRRLGHLLRRRRGLQLARGRRAVGGGRDGRDVDRPLLGAHAARSREVRAVVAGLAGSIPPNRRDPSLDAVQAAAFAGNSARRASRGPRRARASPSSARSRRPSSWRRGGATSCSGSTRAAQAFAAVTKGPKVLYVGLHGHAPSTFPAADTELPHVARCAPGSTATCARIGLRRGPSIRRDRARRRSPARSRQPRARRCLPSRPTTCLVPGRHDVRAQRQGRPDVRADPKRHRDLRSSDGQGVDRCERRLVEARRRAHRSHAKRAGDRRQRRRRADEAAARRSVDDPAGEPGDVRPARARG